MIVQSNFKTLKVFAKTKCSALYNNLLVQNTENRIFSHLIKLEDLIGHKVEPVMSHKFDLLLLPSSV